MNTITVITFLFPRHDKPHSLFTSAHLEKTVKSTDSSLEFICVTTELDAIESAVHSTQCFGCTNTIDLWRRPIDTLWHVTKWLGLFESYRIKWGSSRLLDPYYQEESTQYVSIRKYTICIFFLFGVDHCFKCLLAGVFTVRSQWWWEINRKVKHVQVKSRQSITFRCMPYLWLIWVASTWALARCTFCRSKNVAGQSTWRHGSLCLGWRLRVPKYSASPSTYMKNYKDAC